MINEWLSIVGRVELGVFVKAATTPLDSREAFEPRTLEGFPHLPNHIRPTPSITPVFLATFSQPPDGILQPQRQL